MKHKESTLSDWTFIKNKKCHIAIVCDRKTKKLYVDDELVETINL